MNLGDSSVLPILQNWVGTDRIEGWIVMANLAKPDLNANAKALADQIKLPPNAAARTADGVRIVELAHQPSPPLAAETVSVVVADLMTRPQFAPMRTYCEAHLPLPAKPLW